MDGRCTFQLQSLQLQQREAPTEFALSVVRHHQHMHVESDLVWDAMPSVSTHATNVVAILHSRTVAF